MLILVGLLVWCWGIQRRNQTFLKKMLWEHVCRVCWWMLLGGFGCQARHRIGWKSRGDKKNSFCAKAAMLRRRGKIIGQLVWLFRPLLVGTALWRMQSTSDWTQVCHRGHISWYQLMTHATHKIFPTGSESLPVCCKKTTGIPLVVTAVPFFLWIRPRTVFYSVGPPPSMSSCNMLHLRLDLREIAEWTNKGLIKPS